MADQYLADGWGWSSALALAELPDGSRAGIPSAYEAAEALCRPIDRQKLIQRLTALGITMAPNRSSADAQMWLHETARLLSDIAEDVLLQAVDECQLKLRFLPTVAEIRAIADPIMEKRRKDKSRLDAMRRFLASGKPLPRKLPPAPRPVMERRGEPMSAEETEKLNTYLESAGSCFRYHDDGSREQVAPMPKCQYPKPAPSMPTRADYIAMGVDPSVLDSIEAESTKASG